MAIGFDEPDGFFVLGLLDRTGRHSWGQGGVIMNRSLLATISVVCISLGGCGGPAADRAPVVAKVDGQPITTTDLRLEQAGPNGPPETSDPAAESAALRRVIERILMAQAAHEQKLDRSAEFGRAEARAVDGLKAAALARKLIAATPQPSPEVISKFITEHPRAFAERKFIVVDQLRMDRLTAPIKTDHPPQGLEGFAALFDQAKVPYERRVDIVDTGAADPKLLASLAATQPGAIFQANSPGGVTLSQILETRSAPLTGLGAEEIARSFLRNQAAEALAAAYVAKLYSTVGAKVEYSPGYSAPKGP